MPRVIVEEQNVRIHNQTPKVSAIEESKVSADEIAVVPLSKSGFNFLTEDKNYNRDESKNRKEQKQKEQFLANKLINFRITKKSNLKQKTPKNQSKLRK